MLILLGSAWYDAYQFIRHQTLLFNGWLPVCNGHFATLIAHVLTSSAFEKNSKVSTFDFPCKPSQLEILLFLICRFSMSDCIELPALYLKIVTGLSRVHLFLSRVL